MFHFTLNCVLFIALVILLFIHFTSQSELFVGNCLNATKSSMSKGYKSVFSSAPDEAEFNSAWIYAIPFQSTCTGVGNKCCPKGQQFTCVLTPHNQRRCTWS